MVIIGISFVGQDFVIVLIATVCNNDLPEEKLNWTDGGVSQAVTDFGIVMVSITEPVQIRGWVEGLKTQLTWETSWICWRVSYHTVTDKRRTTTKTTTIAEEGYVYSRARAAGTSINGMLVIAILGILPWQVLSVVTSVVRILVTKGHGSLCCKPVGSANVSYLEPIICIIVFSIFDYVAIHPYSKISIYKRISLILNLLISKVRLSYFWLQQTKIKAISTVVSYKWRDLKLHPFSR